MAHRHSNTQAACLTFMADMEIGRLPSRDSCRSRAAAREDDTGVARGLSIPIPKDSRRMGTRPPAGVGAGGGLRAVLQNNTQHSLSDY